MMVVWGVSEAQEAVDKWYSDFLPFDPSEVALNSNAFGFCDSIVSDIIIVFEANQ